MKSYETRIFLLIVGTLFFFTLDAFALDKTLPGKQHFRIGNVDVVERLNREGLVFFKSLIGLSKTQVVKKFPARTDKYPLGWVHSKDCTLFTSRDTNAGSQVEVRYKNGRVIRVREARWTDVITPDSPDGLVYERWIR